jgi:cytochrome d ubiquinol oxidase subunit II
MAQIGLIVMGWALGQYPYLVYPDITVANAAAPDEVLLPVTVALGLGMVILVPSFFYLYRVFKGEKEAQPHAAGISPPESTASATEGE